MFPLITLKCYICQDNKRTYEKQNEIDLLLFISYNHKLEIQLKFAKYKNQNLSI